MSPALLFVASSLAAVLCGCAQERALATPPAPASATPSPSTLAAAPAPTGAATEASGATTSGASPSSAAAPPASGAPATRPAYDSQACREALAIGAPEAECDAGFVPHDRNALQCERFDLMCLFLQQAVERVPLGLAPPPNERGACLEECQRGNAASCGRLSELPSHREATAIGCVHALAARACELGIASRCDGGDRKVAHERLSAGCQAGRASWQCFYLVHEHDRTPSSPSRPRARAGFAATCRGTCLPPPERCYRELACSALRDLETRPPP